MGTVRFVLRTDKPNKEGISPIDLIYQIKRKRKYFRTSEKLFSENWDAKQQQAVYVDKRTAKKLLPMVVYNVLPSSKEVDEINTRLSSIRKEITDIETRYQLNKEVYTTEMVIMSLKSNRSPLTKREAPTNELYNFIDTYINDHKATREPGSLSVYKSLKNHLQHFQNDKKIKVTFDSIDYKFFQDFQNYLVTPRKVLKPSKIKLNEPKWKEIELNNITVAKQLSTLKTFLNYARMHGHKIPDQYKEFKIKKENLEVIALTSEEFEILFGLDLTANNKLSQVRDVFCFACATGLRFSDILQLKREHIKKEDIRLVVKKTKEMLSIPLTPYSQSILERYAAVHKPLPLISNQKTNDYIKELCKLAGINEAVEIVRFRGSKRETTVYPKYELISVHTGRKTFCTLSLEKGMSAEEVMQISGHKDYQSFKRYVKITEKRTKVVMSKAWGTIKKSNLKAV
ncbi:MAG: site-specific integrase [Chitinophagaceae bacterium]|nr:site-specific integrase [Chitinophagaceae bacterium]